MGAKLTDDVRVATILGPTGYDVPAEFLGKTWGDVKSSGNVTLSAWKNDTAIVYTKKAVPTTEDKALVPAATGLSEAVIAAVAEEAASITIGETVYTRYADGDVSVL
jgi:hypothetical protein